MVHHEVRGSGPVLLIAQSGEGDTARGAPLARLLADRFTVVTYDRRGLSRSPADGKVDVRAHAEDVHHLLASLTDEPAYVLGCSLGALIGLHLAQRHPDQVATLVAHEPVAPWLLPPAERAHHVRELEGIQHTYRTAGLSAAVVEIAAALGIDPVGQETEPDVARHPMTPGRAANFAFFLTHDLTAIREDDLVLDTAARIVPAVGATTPRTAFDVRCARELGRRVGVDPVVFPGGHNGDLTHPRGYAARLVDVLTAPDRPRPPSAAPALPPPPTPHPAR
ncbi:alpha/beta hydrolase [Actinosynnema sp. NPDC020468]|uniref:alpha/beta hydrolase n=1 Tax=Actinosynnema sp. NPDC020468 TaxID=3154488 RepID=UPI00341065C1